jgi:hypothetical protein
VEGGFYAEYFQLGDRSFNNFGGILHLPIGDRWTLNYHIGFGTSLNRGIFVHATAGTVSGIWVLNEMQGTGIRVGYLSFLLCIVPEGVGYYLPNKSEHPKFLTHISVNPLGVEYFYNNRTHEEWGKMSCDVVARFKMQTSLKFPGYLAPHIAATWIYTPGATTSQFGLKAGITIGFEAKE